jgi:hypothetical protein
MLISHNLERDLYLNLAPILFIIISRLLLIIKPKTFSLLKRVSALSLETTLDRRRFTLTRKSNSGRHDVDRTAGGATSFSAPHHLARFRSGLGLGHAAAAFVVLDGMKLAGSATMFSWFSRRRFVHSDRRRVVLGVESRSVSVPRCLCRFSDWVSMVMVFWRHELSKSRTPPDFEVGIFGYGVFAASGCMVFVLDFGVGFCSFCLGWWLLWCSFEVALGDGGGLWCSDVFWLTWWRWW